MGRAARRVPRQPAAAPAGPLRWQRQLLRIGNMLSQIRRLARNFTRTSARSIVATLSLG
jgi:hypothetical protein